MSLWIAPPEKIRKRFLAYVPASVWYLSPICMHHCPPRTTHSLGCAGRKWVQYMQRVRPIISSCYLQELRDDCNEIRNPASLMVDWDCENFSLSLCALFLVIKFRQPAAGSSVTGPKIWECSSYVVFLCVFGFDIYVGYLNNSCSVSVCVCEERVEVGVIDLSHY